MKIIMEDNGASGISLLFKSSDFGSCFVFANGVGNLSSYIEQYLNIDDCIVVYMDVVLDNENSYIAYTNLKGLYEENDNVYIIPLFCSEFVMLSMLYNNFYADFNLSRLDKIFSETEFDKTVFKPFKSMEKCFKSFLGDLGGNKYNCLSNKNVEFIKGNEAAFYIKDCPCNSFCKADTSPINLYDKGNLLYDYLPVRLRRDAQVKQEWDDCKVYIQQLYNNYSLRFGFKNLYLF